MEMQQYHQIPDRFKGYFKKRIKQRFPIINNNISDENISKFYQLLMMGKFNQNIDNILKQFTLQNYKIQQLRQFLLEQHKQIKRIYQIYKKITDQVQDLKQQSMNQDRFLIFINRFKLRDEDFFSNLLKLQPDLQINNREQMIKELDKIQQNKNQQQFNKNGQQILETYTDINDLNNDQTKKKIIQYFYQRNKSYHEVKNILQDYDFQDYQQKIKLLYSLQKTQQQFHIHAKEILKLYCSKIDKMKQDSIKKITLLLFTQIKSLNKQNIIRILMESKLKQFKSKQNVTFDIIKQIYQLKDQSQLNIDKKQQQISIIPQPKRLHQVVEHPQIFSLPSPKGQRIKPSKNQVIPNIMESKSQNNFPFKTQNKDDSTQSQPIIDKDTTINNKDDKQIQSKSKYIKIIKQQLNILKESTKNINIPIFQIILRQLQLAISQNNFLKISEKCQKMQELLKKYQIHKNNHSHIINQIQQIRKQSALTGIQRQNKVKKLKQQMECLNLQEIYIAKQACKNNKNYMKKDAIVLIGESGVGKSTLFVGLSGHKLILDKKLNFYRPSDPKVEKLVSISDSSVSVTSCPNISKFPSNWVGDKEIYAVDTPGLDDNRSAEIDIINNIGTIQLLRKFKSIRIVIVISQKQLADRAFGPLKKLIKQISNLLVKVKQFENSITFILSKGLTKQDFSKILNEIDQSLFKDNEKQFLKIMKKKIAKLNSAYNEFHDPARHQYQQLSSSFIQMMQAKLSLQSCFSCSFSEQAKRKIKQTQFYLQKMIKKAIQLKEYQIAKLYLNRIKFVSEISDFKFFQQIKPQVPNENQQKKIYNTKYQQLKKDIKQIFENKLQSIWKNVQNFKKHIYQKQYIEMIKNGIQQLEDQQNISLYKVLYQNGEQTINNKLNKKKTILLQQSKNNLAKPSQKKYSDRKLVEFDIQIIRLFGSQQQATLKKQQINKIKQQHLQQIGQYIKIKKNFKKDQWNTKVKDYKNLIRIGQNFLGDNQFYNEISEKIVNYIKQKPQQVKQIQSLLSSVKQKQLQGVLQQNCKLYLDKLNNIQQKNIHFKQVLKDPIKMIISSLQQKYIEIKDIQDQNFQGIECQSISKLKIYAKNRQEIVTTLSHFNDSPIIPHKNVKEEQKIIKKIVDNLQLKIKDLKQQIQSLSSKQQQQINLEKVHNHLKCIFKAIQYIQQQVQQLKDNKYASKNLKLKLNQCNSILESIYKVIKRKSTTINLRNYQVNFKLIVYVFFLSQIQMFEKNNQNLKITQKTIQEIKNKLLKPFEEINTIKFNNQSEFQRFYNTMKYLHQLDQKINKVYVQAKGSMQPFFKFLDNDLIIPKLDQCFNVLNKKYQVFKKIFIQFDQLDKLYQSNSQYYLQQQQLINNSKQFQISNLMYNIQRKKTTQQIQNQKRKKSYQKQKQCFKTINYQNQKSAILYLKQFKYIQNIIDQFKQDFIKIKQYRSQFLQNQNNKINLKQQIKKRISNLQKLIFNKNQIYSRQKLMRMQKQLNFLTDIMQSVKEQYQNNNYQKIKQKLSQLIYNILKNFSDSQQHARQVYQKVNPKTSFTQLSNLINHPASKVGGNYKKTQELIKKIDEQYFNILEQYFTSNFQNASNQAQIISQLSNIHTFVNLYTHNTRYKGKIQSQFLKKMCKLFFLILRNKFEKIFDDLKTGLPFKKQMFQQLSKYQKTIERNLKHQYQQFLKDNVKGFQKEKVQQHYYYHLGLIKQNQIKLQRATKYLSGKVEIDQQLKYFYQFAQESVKKSIRDRIIQQDQNKIRQVKQILKQDYKKYEEQINKMQNRLEKYPQTIKKITNYKLIQLAQIKSKQFMQFHNQVKVLEENENLLKILEKSQKIKNMNNQQFQKLIWRAIQKYYENQIQNLAQFNQIDKIKIILNKNIQITSKSQYVNISKEKQKLNYYYNNFLSEVINYIQLYKNRALKLYQQQKKLEINITEQQNYQDTFNIDRINYPKLQATSLLCRYLQIIGDYQNQFNKNIKEMNEIINKKVIEQINQFKILIQKFKILIININNKQYPSKRYLIELIKSTQIKKKICQNLKQVLKIQKIIIKNQSIENNQKFYFTQLNKTSQLINQYDINCIKKIKQILKQKLGQSKKWNLEDQLSNDTFEKLKLKNNQIIQTLDFLSFCIPIFNQNKRQKNQMCLYEQIQKVNEDQFDQFQKDVINQIELYFKLDTNIDLSKNKTREYYKFKKYMNQNNLSMFPSNMRIKDTVKNLILERYRQKVQNIWKFCQDEQKNQEFQKLINDRDDYSASFKQFSLKLQNQRKQKLAKFQEQEKGKQSKQQFDQMQQNELLKEKEKLQLQFKGNKQAKEKQLKDEDEIEIAKFQKNKQAKMQQIKNFIYNEITVHLIIMRRALSQFNCQKQILKKQQDPQQKISELLEKLQKKFHKKFTKIIYQTLVKSRNHYSIKIVNQNQIFIHLKPPLFQLLTANQTFDKLLDKIIKSDTLASTDKESIKQILTIRYQGYLKCYNQLLDQYSISEDSKLIKKNIYDRAFILGQSLKKMYFQEQQYQIVKKQHLIAHILALWTINYSRKDQNDKTIFPSQPHPGQLLSIFMLLQVQKQNFKKQIAKAMIQVSTGQGKSLILGCLSAYLGLCGFKVYVACYSQYLSKRDYKNFQKLFQMLQIKHNIIYDIFPEICKKMLNQLSKQQFLEKVYNYILTQTIQEKSSLFQQIIKKGSELKNKFDQYKQKIVDFFKGQKQNNSILLIDEVDVFLDQQYLEKNYFPSILLKSKMIQKLLYYFWQNRQKIKFFEIQQIEQSQEFKNVINQLFHPTLKQIIKNQLRGMMRGILQYKQDRKYIVQKDKILYKQADGLSNKVHFGYRTIFSYFHEFYITQKIKSKENFLKQIGISLIAASFSYSMLPTYFRSILGVTGTLQSINKAKSKILTDKFKIDRSFIQPSIYNQSRRKVSIKRCDISKLHAQIVASIEQQHIKKRPIIIFFLNKDNLYEFNQSKQYKEFTNSKSISSIVTQQLNARDRDFRIERSTYEEQITLLTFDFARGTDFKVQQSIDVKDDQLKKQITELYLNNPGLHVISTFKPKNYSDYIQLIGRTGRQGQNGSILILIPQQGQVSEQINITRQQFQQKIIKQDNNKWKQSYKILNDNIDKCNNQHKKSMNIYKNSKLDDIAEFIQQLNYQPPIYKIKSKTAICIDGTYSMDKVFLKVIQVVQSAMPDIYQVLKKQKIQIQVYIQIFIYQNYNSSYEKLLEFSPQTTKYQQLVEWLRDKKVGGGWGNQAIQVCLQQLNKKQDLSQFIIIADAAANQKQETDKKRLQKGQQYWNKNNFPKAYFQDELKNLKKKKVKAHSYYIGSYNKTFFYNISNKQANEISQQFMIQSQEATQNFVKFVANIIISDISKQKGVSKEDLMHEYMKAFQRRRYL